MVVVSNFLSVIRDNVHYKVMFLKFTYLDLLYNQIII